MKTLTPEVSSTVLEKMLLERDDEDCKQAERIAGLSMFEMRNEAMALKRECGWATTQRVLEIRRVLALMDIDCDLREYEAELRENYEQYMEGRFL